MTQTVETASGTATAAARITQHAGAEPRDYVLLLKPRVMSLVLFTAFVGLLLAPGTLHPVLALTALLCIAVGAGGAGALNMWFDADIDARMARTARRPIPSGRIERGEALGMGLTLSLGSVCLMGLLINLAAAVLLAITIAFYGVVYTMWLKRRTPQNIVIGGAAGAFPPMIGYATVTGSVTPESLLLFAIIFFWTPPHFWALSLFCQTDYARVGVPVLVNVAGEASTRRQIFGYSLILAPLGVSPALLGMAGMAFGVIAGVLGATFVFHAWCVLRGAEGAERRLFGFSILYLFLIFATLGAERIAGALAA